MLQVARARSDIEWILGDLSSASWHREFDLALMTGHAFQVLVGDDEIRRALATIRTALAPGRVFAFETRTPERGVVFADRDGTVVRFETEVEDAGRRRYRSVHQLLPAGGLGTGATLPQHTAVSRC